MSDKKVDEILDRLLVETKDYSKEDTIIAFGSILVVCLAVLEGENGRKFILDFIDSAINDENRLKITRLEHMDIPGRAN